MESVNKNINKPFQLMKKFSSFNIAILSKFNENKMNLFFGEIKKISYKNYLKKSNLKLILQKMVIRIDSISQFKVNVI